MLKLKKSLIVLTISLCLLVQVGLYAQETSNSNNPWTSISESSIVIPEDQERQIFPTKYLSYQLDEFHLKSIVDQASLRFSETDIASSPVILTLPMPDGSFQQFKIHYAPVMHPNLAARYPMIRSFSGQGIEDPSAYVRFDLTQKGFHAMVLSSKTSTVFIDPFTNGNTKNYQTYYKKDFVKTDPIEFSCGVDSEVLNKEKSNNEEHPFPPANLSSSNAGDCKLRTYRLALAVVGEYTQFHGGTVPSALAAMNTSMTRINGVYEKDFGISMIMVENNDQLVFINPASDPYSNNAGDLGNNQTTCDNVIGFNNYDIGHLMTTGGGGVAQLNSPCTSNKAQGLSGQGDPVGDPFDIDYVAHEMGHQFGANHTQNNNCNRNGPTAMEPGSASTIMGYAGICTPNVQFNSDDYFHAISIEEISQNITNGSGSTCATEFTTGNNQPMVDGGSNYTLPVSTPFTLTATASDDDPADMLTYCWEQMDNQTATAPPISTETRGPAFRSLDPMVSPSRTFPNLVDLKNNVDPEWEELPSVSRTMNFRCTVRDNFMGAGCTVEDDIVLTFSEEAGPFLVENPNTALIWNVGNFEIVTWEVANTDQAPVSCSFVNILLSTDGGLTYPIVLAENIANNGSHEINVPDHIGTTNRVMVVCADNIFFDISNMDFSIEAALEPSIVTSLTPTNQVACATSESISFIVKVNPIGGFDEMIDLTFTGLPAMVDLTFSPSAQVIPPAEVTVIINNPEVLAAGENTFTLNANSNAVSSTNTGVIQIVPGLATEPQLTAPTNNAVGIPTNFTLQWESVDLADFYVVDIATNPSFDAGSIVETNVAMTNTYQAQNLTLYTVYYWRVRPANACGNTTSTHFFSFQTINPACLTYSSTDIPVVLSESAIGTYTPSITVNDDRIVSDLNVNLEIEHTWIGDLIGVLIPPNGNSYALFDRPGTNGGGYGCREDDIDVVFDDDASNNATAFENSCNTNGTAIQGVYQSIDPLSFANGQSSQGVWTLELQDIFQEDGGQINNFSLEICSSTVAPNAIALANQLLSVEEGMSELITSSFLQGSSDNNNPNQIIYLITSLPQNGTLFLDGVPVIIGTTFTQEDIDNNLISYTHDGSETNNDSFIFDLLNNENTWSNNNTFSILIYNEELSAVAMIDAQPSCSEASDGMVTINTFGGTPPFQYSQDGSTFQSSNVFSLPAGVYTFLIMDATNATFTTNEISIEAPTPIEISPVVTDNSVGVFASGGTGGLMYSMDGQNYQTDPVFSDLANGDYTVYVQDENNCIVSSSITVAYNSLVVNLVINAEVSCTDQQDGELLVSVSGGTMPFQYSLDGENFQDESIFSNLAPGTYTIVVMDAEGYTRETTPVTIGNPSEVTLTTTLLGNDLTLLGAGGTADYQYSVDGSTYQTENIFMDLPDGDYTVYVQDANGCTTQEELMIITTGVNDLDQSFSFEVLPNPNTGLFTLRLAQDNTEAVSLTIYDMIGQAVYVENLGNGLNNFEQTIDIRHLSRGVYIINVKSGDEFASKRLILIK